MSNQTPSVVRFAGKVALVQGGSRGIGAAIVQRLAREGASVAFTYAASKERAAELVRTIEAEGGKVLAIHADSADAEAVRSAVSQTVSAFGRLDILVNNAGVLAIAPLAEFSLEDFDRTLAVNVRGVFVATQAAVRHMGQGGAYGRVITIGSTNSDRLPWAGFSVYGMSKAAIVGLTKGLARDLGPRGITVNNVQPGPVNTDMNPADGPMAGDMHGMMAVNRHADPAEIAGMVAYLAGPESGMVTGASLLIDGGFAA